MQEPVSVNKKQLLQMKSEAIYKDSSRKENISDILNDNPGTGRENRVGTVVPAFVRPEANQSEILPVKQKD